MSKNRPCAAPAGTRRFFIGTTHERPDMLVLNQHLARCGSEWRVAVAKCIGLCIWNPRTQVHRGAGDDGFVTVPDL